MSEINSQNSNNVTDLQTIREDALRAWQEFESNGLHVTAQEADKWLEELAQGQNTAPPKPHL